MLAAHEAKDNFRHNIVNSQLAAIQKELELLQASQNIDIKAILDFAKQYRKQIGHNCSYITPPNLQSTRRHPIDSLYVSPDIIPNNISIQAGQMWQEVIEESLEPLALDRSTFFAQAYRAVLLGNPGAGKSTMAIKLCHDLANSDTGCLFAGRQGLIPILITLRVYGADKQKSKCSLLDFIETEAKTIYQMPSIPSKAFHYLLTTGQAMIIFDGLDELLDTSYRQEIRNDIELFCQLYPSVPTLVTSREVGYEQAPLNEKMFEVYRLAPFDDEQIEDYVQKWFTIAEAENISTIRRQGLAEKFLEDSSIVPDLRSNPLMLALLCTIYREEGYIPRYRPDVYEKCAVMLFERWDKGRNIYTPPLPEEHVRPLLEYLAHWIYANPQLRAGLTETALQTKAAAYLHEALYEDRVKAERVAREFVQFCTGRAWVFIDTGTQRDGENLYQFAHATFLEYFAASHLVRASSSPSSLLKVLMPHIARREWDLMAQLAFQLYSKQNTGASDKLLIGLIERLQTRAKEKEKFNLLLFAARCLQFIIPRPNTRCAIATACVTLCISWGSKLLDRETSPKTDANISNSDKTQPDLVLDTFSDLIDENYTTVMNTLVKLLPKYVDGENDDQAVVALEIAIYLEQVSKGFCGLLNEILGKSSRGIEHLYTKSLLLCQNQIWTNNLYINKFVELYDIESLFTTTTFFKNDNGNYSMSNISFLLIVDDIHKYQKMLEDIGTFLITYPTPWIKIVTAIFYGDSITKQRLGELDSLALFGFFCIAAINEEMIAKRFKSEYLSLSDQHPIYYLLKTRFIPRLSENIQNWLDQCHFTFQQQDFIWRWIRKEISLVADDDTIQSDNEQSPHIPQSS